MAATPGKLQLPRETNAMAKQPSQSKVGLALQLLLLIVVVMTGSLNNIMKQIAARPLHSYTYMLQLSTAVIYIPVYCGACVLSMALGWIPRWQMDFIWKTAFQIGLPVGFFFFLAALGDTVGDGLGMIATPYVAGPIHSLLSNFTPIWIAILDMTLLSGRYSVLQCIGMTLVMLAVGVGITPTLMKGGTGNTNIFFAGVIAFSCFFNAFSWIIKDAVFSRFEGWKILQKIDDNRGLHVFAVNAHVALFTLPCTLFAVPLNAALGQMHGKGFFTYVTEGVSCIFGSCGGTKGEDFALIAVALYVFFNFTWMLSILLSVKVSGALPVFIALKAIFPVSTILFASIDWPLMGRVEMDALEWLSVALMIPAIATYQYASDQQKKRRAEGTATCCWPLSASRPRFKEALAKELLMNVSTQCEGTPDANACLLRAHRDGVRSV